MRKIAIYVEDLENIYCQIEHVYIAKDTKLYVCNLIIKIWVLKIIPSIPYKLLLLVCLRFV